MFNADRLGSFIIKGTTSDGRVFRPSDWADRLCSVMSAFNDHAATGPGAALQYSPYVQPTSVDDVKGVAVDGRLFELEPMAYRFLLSFARDNDLTIQGEALRS